MMINLDSAATTRPDPTVVEKILPYINEDYANPNSDYKIGRKLNEKIENAREYVKKYLNGDGDVVFTSSSSASNTLGIKGFMERYSRDYNIIYSPMEHVDILDCIDAMQRLYGSNVYSVDILNSTIDLGNLEALCRYVYYVNSKKPFVIINMVNNELGVINNIKKITEIVHAYNGIVLSDCTQAIHKIDIDINELCVDMITFGGHKIHALRGVGVLYKDKKVKLEPLVYGHQGLFSGTQNTAAIMSLYEALKLDNGYEYIKELQKYFEKRVLEIEDTYINGISAERFPYISNVCFQRCDSETMKMLLDMDDIYVSNGSACNSKDIEPSKVLKAIGLKEPDIYCCLRFSFSEDITYEQIDYVIDKLKEHTSFIRSMCASDSTSYL